MTVHSEVTAPELRARAILDHPAKQTVAGFRQFAEALGLQAETGADYIIISFNRGQVTLMPDGLRTSICINSSETVNMQLIRDAVASQATQMGLTVDWLEKSAPGRPANMSLATLVEVRRLTPSYSRVVIEGTELDRFTKGGMHFRLLFGPEGAGWPTTDEGGVTQWPGGADAWHRPVYTTRAIRQSPNGTTRIDFDVFLHDGGRVTEWTRRAKPGVEVGMTGPGGGRGPGSANRHLLIGDETAVPVIARILSEFTAETQGHAILVVPEAGDIQDLSRPPGVQLDWVLRGTGQTPLSLLLSQDIPADDRFVFFAGERSEVLAARENLLALGLTKSEFHAAAYWTAKPV